MPGWTIFAITPPYQVNPAVFKTRTYLGFLCGFTKNADWED